MRPKPKRSPTDIDNGSSAEVAEFDSTTTSFTKGHKRRGTREGAQEKEAEHGAEIDGWMDCLIDAHMRKLPSSA